MNSPHATIEPFPPVTAGQALEIAQRQLKNAEEIKFEVHAKKPANFHPYGDFPDEPCWYVQIQQPNAGVLCSSQMVMISRLTGKVLYYGSAGDEG